MRIPPIALALLLVWPGSSVLLRYRFEPGKVYRFTLTDQLVRKVRTGEGTERVILRQSGKSTVVRRISTSAPGQGSLEETPADGTTTVESPAGKATDVMPSITRVTVMDTRGKLIKIVRKGAAGSAEIGSQVLDGLTLSLPEKPVSPGARWTETVSVVGIDESHARIPVRLESRYVGDEKRAGHLSAHLECAVSSTFQVKTKSGVSLPGKLSGTISYWLARDVGQDVDTVASLRIVVTAGGTAKSPSMSVWEFTSRQSLVP